MIVELNNAFIKKGLTCPPNKRKIEYVDSKRSGLYISVQSSSQGIGTYYLRYNKAEGKTSHLKLGRTDVISLSEARKLVVKFKSEINLGADPAAKKSALNDIPTLSEFFTEQYTPYASIRKRSFDKDLGMFKNRICPVFARKRLDQITRKEVMVFHSKLRVEDKLSANSADHHVKLLKRLLYLAVEWEIIPKNCLARIPLYNEDTHVAHYLSEDELIRLLKVLKTHKNRPTCNVLLFLLCTGARLNEALSATHSQISLEKRIWTITALNSKSKRQRTVPLNDAAMALINELDPTTEYLFTSRRTGTRLKSIHTGWKSIRDAAGLPRTFRIHDIRHSHASMISGTSSLYQIQRLLGHSVISVTAKYSHLTSSALLDASQGASDTINAAMASIE